MEIMELRKEIYRILGDLGPSRCVADINLPKGPNARCFVLGLPGYPSKRVLFAPLDSISTFMTYTTGQIATKAVANFLQ